MQGMSPFGVPGAQGAPGPGMPGMGQQMMGQPWMGSKMMGKPWMGSPMMGKPMGDKMMMPGMAGKGFDGMAGGPMFFGGMIPIAPRGEETYVENILRMNRGKVATVYTTNENNPEWAAKIFKGRVENAARDHVVLSDPQTGQRSIVLMVNIDYITFDEPLNYQPSIYGS